MSAVPRRVVATILARTASARLPAKVLEPVAGKPLLAHVVARAGAARCVDEVVVATTGLSQDDSVADVAAGIGVECFRGSAEDVLERTLAAARASYADDVIPLTADNPLIDPELIDDVVAFYRNGSFDYVTTTHMHHSLNWHAERTFPVGVSVQVCSIEALTDAAVRATDPIARTHATFAIYNHPERYRLAAFEAAGKYEGWRYPDLRLTVDMPEDLALIREVFDALYPRNPLFSTEEAIRLVACDERLQSLNRHIVQRLVHREVSEARR